MKHTKKICILASAAILGVALLGGCGEKKEQAPTVKVDVPVVSGKQPSQYTWEEYLAMDEARREAFRKSFGSDAVFEAWMEKAQRQEPTEESAELPWEQGGKQPADYTWAEFEALTGEQQMAFQSALGPEAFEAWLNRAQNLVEPNPWDQPGAKQPADYTWAEFEELSAAHQMTFQSALGEEGFEQWLTQAQRQAMPWEDGGKEPADYTWAEFEALTGEQQMAFQDSFESQAAFDAWLEDNMPRETKPAMPWEQGGKQPADYTWAEFEALTGEQQMAFQSALGTEAFEAWLDRAQNLAERNPWDQPGAKQPEEYTWAEFEALSPELQIIFQSSFASEDGFEKWLMDNMPQ